MRREGTRKASFLYLVEEERVAEVGLYVCHTVVAYGKHLGHGDTFRGEVTRHIYKGVVLLFRGAEHSNQTLAAVIVRQAEIAAVRARRRQLGHFCRRESMYVGI